MFQNSYNCQLDHIKMAYGLNGMKMEINNMNVVIQIIKKQINLLNIMRMVKLLKKDIISYPKMIGMIQKQKSTLLICL